MNIRGSLDVLSAREKATIHAAALRLLEEQGFLVQNRELLDLLESFGATVHRAQETARFPRKLMERFIADAADAMKYEDGMECSCTFPDPTRPARCGGIEATAGTYPHLWMDLDGKVALHTCETVADGTRLGDALPGYDRLGAFGCPSDVPLLLGPLYMRLLAWRHAANKLSNSGEVRDNRLIPYTIEMAKVMSAHKRCSLRRYAFAEVELVPPWRFRREEAETFVAFWKQGLLCGISSMISAGGSGPVTLAGTLAMMVAESLFISVLYRQCYGWKQMFMQANSSVLDMKAGMFPSGRPERLLLIFAMSSMARHYRALYWASAISCDAKVPSPESGYQEASAVISALLAGSLGLECFGVLSCAEMNSATQLVLDSEYLTLAKRVARGFEINEETLALDTILSVGAGGLFTDTEHTVQNFRKELWEPTVFSRENYNSWLASGRQLDTDRAREIARKILKEHHPAGMDAATEKALRKIIRSAEKTLRAG